MLPPPQEGSKLLTVVTYHEFSWISLALLASCQCRLMQFVLPLDNKQSALKSPPCHAYDNTSSQTPPFLLSESAHEQLMVLHTCPHHCPLPGSMKLLQPLCLNWKWVFFSTFSFLIFSKISFTTSCVLSPSLHSKERLRASLTLKL